MALSLNLIIDKYLLLNTMSDYGQRDAFLKIFCVAYFNCTFGSNL